MRTLLLIPLLSVVGLSGCGQQQQQLQVLLDRQEQAAAEADALTSEVAKLRTDYLKLIATKDQRFQEFAEGVKALNQASDEIRQVMTDFSDYKQAYRERIWAEAPGMEFPVLATRDQQYHDVTVRRLDAAGIAIMHRHGSATLSLDSLPKESQDFFAYDPTLEAVLRRSKGTGTDWLLSAMAAADAALSESETRVKRMTTSTTASSNSVSPATPSSYYAAPPVAEPFWKSRSSFTGSYWAPLQERQKKVGSVNTYSTGFF